MPRKTSKSSSGGEAVAKNKKIDNKTKKATTTKQNDTNKLSTPPKPQRTSFKDLDRSATFAELGIGFNKATFISVMENIVYGCLFASIPVAMLYYFMVSEPYRRDATILRIPDSLSYGECNALITEAEAANPSFINKMDNGTAIASVMDFGPEFQPMLSNFINEKLRPQMANSMGIDPERLFVLNKDMYVMKRNSNQTSDQERYAFRNYMSDFSFQVTLNEVGHGGDLQFELQSYKPLSTQVGEAVVWPTKLYHSATAVEEGTVQYILVGFAGYNTGIFSTPYGQFMSCAKEYKDNTFSNAKRELASGSQDNEVACEDDECPELAGVYLLPAVEESELECNFVYRLMLNKMIRKFSIHLSEEYGYFYAFNYLFAGTINFAIIFLGVRAFAYKAS